MKFDGLDVILRIYLLLIDTLKFMNIVAFDIGNSRIKIGFFKENILEDFFFIPTGKADELVFPSQWREEKVDLLGISSVVPRINPVIIEKISTAFPQTDVKVIKATDCGISLKIKNSDTVGVDRVLNCLAAKKLFGNNIVIVDIGTAITFDILSKKGEFLGGVIIPGPPLWEKSFSHTAMMPPFENSKNVIPGKNTSEAVAVGIKFGIPGAINNILEKIFKKYSPENLILTGGGSLKFSRSIKYKKRLREHLTLEGVNYAVTPNSKKSF